MSSPRPTFSNLPLELFRLILVEAVRVRGTKRALRLRLVSKLFSEEVPEVLLALGLYGECHVYLDKMPFVRTALTKRLLEHRTSGLIILNTVHKVAEQLVVETGEAEKFEEYALSLLQLVSLAGEGEVRQMLRPGTGYWEPEGFEYELLTAGAYMNKTSLVRRLVKSPLLIKAGMFGDPYKAALLGRNFDLLNTLFEHNPSTDIWRAERLVALAAYKGDREMVDFIYQAEWSPSKPKSDHCTRRRIDTILRTPDPKIFEIIMREREFTNEDLTPRVFDHLLCTASSRGWVNMIRYIFSLGGIPEVPTSIGLSTKGNAPWPLWPLYRACEAGHDEVVRLLLPYQVHALGLELETAASHGNISTLKLLLERGAVINIELAKNCVAVAAAKGYLGIVRMLLDAGMNPNDGDIVPMVHAVRAEHPQICQLLIERGATMSVVEAITEVSKAGQGCLRTGSSHEGIDERRWVSNDRGLLLECKE